MGKTVSTIKGVRKDAYFEALVNSAGSPNDILERLQAEVKFAGVLNTKIPRGNLARKTPPAGKTKTARKATSAAPSTPKEAEEKKEAPADIPFDPYAIHTTNVFKQEGAEGLKSALDAISNPEHLKSMITAQRIPVKDFDTGADMDVLRNQVVDAVGSRIADRKAASN